MWTTLLGTLLLLLGLAQAQFAPLEQERDDETANAETPYYVTLNSMIERFLLEQQQYFDDRLEVLESKIGEMCSNTQMVQQQSEELDIDNFVVKLADLMNVFVDKVSEVADTTVALVEDKLNDLSSEVLSSVDNKVSSLSEDLAQMQLQMSTLVTQKQLVQLGSNISAITDTTVTDVKSVLSTLATETLVSSKLQYLADTDLAEIKQLLSNLNEEMETCPSEELFTDIMASITSNRERGLEIAQETAKNFSLLHTQNAQYMEERLQRLLQEVEQNEMALTTVINTVTNMDSDMKTRLTMLQAAAEIITNNTHVPPPTTTSTTTTTTPPPPPPTTAGTLTPCMDSIFPGGSTFMCKNAVRFKKCLIPYVSYHCCRSCTDAGEIPSMGPWRYRDLPREVNILRAFQGWRP